MLDTSCCTLSITIRSRSLVVEVRWVVCRKSVAPLGSRQFLPDSADEFGGLLVGGL